ncbi:MAG: hypothetical protein ACLRSW_04605 [Christensenellaceae bacterium]
MSDLAYKRTNATRKRTKRMKEIFDYAAATEPIDGAKTEREACDYVAKAAEAHGYKPFRFGEKFKAGDKVFYNNRGKNIYLIRVGKADIAKDGIRIVAAHIDSPRVDLKQVPLYESDGVALSDAPLRRCPQISVGRFRRPARHDVRRRKRVRRKDWRGRRN